MSNELKKSNELIARIVKILTDDDCCPIVTSDDVDTYQKWRALRDEVLARGPKYYFITNCVTNRISAIIMKKEMQGAKFHAWFTNGRNTFYVDESCSDKLLTTLLLGDETRTCNTCHQRKGIIEADFEGEKFMRRFCMPCFERSAWD